MSQPISLSKAKAKHLAELLQKKHRQSRREFLVEGKRICNELLTSAETVRLLIIHEKIFSTSYGQEIMSIAQEKKIEICLASENKIAKITETKTPQPIVALVQQKSHDLAPDFRDGNRFLVLVDISDPGNLGTLFRTAEAFSWNNIICTGNTVEIYNPKVVRASMGAIFRLKIACIGIDVLMSFFEYTNVPYFITVPEKGEAPPYHFDQKKYALLLGNEGHGLPEDLKHKASKSLRLPMSSYVESLNVAVAGGILMHLLR